MSKTLNTTWPFRVDLIARRGDDFSVDIEVTYKLEGDETEYPTDLTTSTFRCNILNLEVVAPNVLRLFASSEEMAQMSLGDYKYDIEETSVDGKVKTIINGLFTVKKDYTI